MSSIGTSNGEHQPARVVVTIPLRRPPRERCQEMEQQEEQLYTPMIRSALRANQEIGPVVSNNQLTSLQGLTGRRGSSFCREFVSDPRQGRAGSERPTNGMKMTNRDQASDPLDASLFLRIKGPNGGYCSKKSVRRLGSYYSSAACVPCAVLRVRCSACRIPRW